MLGAITRQLHRGLDRRRRAAASGGGAAGTTSRTRPANGPAAILLAREGQIEFAAAITDWMAETLVDPDTGLVRDGVRLAPDGSVREVDRRIFTYCQGVHLGACVELAARDGHQRWGDRAVALVDAMTHRLAGPDGVLPGCGGGDGGLFAGITARYLADAALRRPELTAAAARHRAGQRRRRGPAGSRSAAGRCSPPTGAARPRARAAASRRPTCRCSSRRGCCSRRRPGCSAR